jgi:hypothetical protein
MKNTEPFGSVEPVETCMDCGGARLVESMETQEFSYGEPQKAVMLSATMPVITCEDCGYQYFDGRGEVARLESICHHLGVQTPQLIRESREMTGFSRVPYCELSGFGIASLQRWESGTGIPNSSTDNLIYLLRFRENVERLQKRKSRTSNADRQTAAVVAPEAHTRCGVKRFARLANRSRVTIQSQEWALRR